MSAALGVLPIATGFLLAFAFLLAAIIAATSRNGMRRLVGGLASLLVAVGLMVLAGAVWHQPDLALKSGLLGLGILAAVGLIGATLMLHLSAHADSLILADWVADEERRAQHAARLEGEDATSEDDA